MRRSKIQRQEERRGRQKSRQQRAIQKKDKATTDEGYIVVRDSDATVTKYLPPLDAEEAVGVSLEHARALAERVDVQVAEGLTFAPIRVGAWRLALGLDENVTAVEAEERYGAVAEEQE